MMGVPRCTGYCHDLGQPCKSEGWSCSWSATAGALHIWTPDNQELADQCPRQTRPGTIPGSRNKERNRRATATRHLATPIPPGYPVYPTYPYPYPAPPPKTNWWAVVSFVLGLVGVIVLSVVCGIVALSQAKRGGGGRGLAVAGLVLSGLWVLPFIAIVVYAVTTGLASDRDIVGADEVEVGDCIAEIPQEARVETVETVDCRQPHAGEVYAIGGA